MGSIDKRYFVEPKGSSAGSIESLLTEGESLLWKGKPRKASFVMSHILKGSIVALIFLLYDAFMLTMIITQMPELPIAAIIGIAVFFAFHLFPLWIWISKIFTVIGRYKNEEYAFTDKRIIVKQGFLAGNIANISYASITSVNLKIGIVEKIYGVGDIYIIADTQKTILEDLEEPYAVITKLQKLANDFKNDIYFPNALREKLGDREGKE